MAAILKLLSVIWASPNTILGLTVGVAGLCTGGSVQLRQGCVEFHGGVVRWLIRRTPLGSSTLALTLGHSILGQTGDTLDDARDHEQIHVRQYERWGPIFLFAYFGASIWLWFTGKDPYRDNPFEIEAYSLVPVRRNVIPTAGLDEPLLN